MTLCSPFVSSFYTGFPRDMKDEKEMFNHLLPTLSGSWRSLLESSHTHYTTCHQRSIPLGFFPTLTRISQVRSLAVHINWPTTHWPNDLSDKTSVPSTWQLFIKKVEMVNHIQRIRAFRDALSSHELSGTDKNRILNLCIWPFSDGLLIGRSWNTRDICDFAKKARIPPINRTWKANREFRGLSIGW